MLMFAAFIIGLLLVLPAKSRSGATDLGFLILLIVVCCFAYSLTCWGCNEAVSFWNGPLPGAIASAIYAIFQVICMGVAMILYVCFWIVVGPIVVMFLGLYSLASKFLK